MSRLALALLVVGCSGQPTQLLVEVSSDLAVPGELDTLEVRAESPGGRTQTAVATLGPGQVPLPRTLAMTHEGGPVGPFRVAVVGLSGGAEVVRRVGELSFRPGAIAVWRVELLSECVGATCGDGETCARGGCRGEAVADGELASWDGTRPTLDAGPYDACVPDEACNGVDDDCDGATDEGFDLETDLENCGGCGVSCAQPNTTSSCVAGACQIDACAPGFDDCDGNPLTGCEVELGTSAAHCGGCGNPCSPPARECCSGTCARSC
ncbi:MAG: hypothetical protein VYE22_27185 [Myxococcota bacterium]|nr:hypothetical protein [Myxococcota bacterium]